jgi:hypothetical protein
MNEMLANPLLGRQFDKTATKKIEYLGFLARSS